MESKRFTLWDRSLQTRTSSLSCPHRTMPFNLLPQPRVTRGGGVHYWRASTRRKHLARNTHPASQLASQPPDTQQTARRRTARQQRPASPAHHDKNDRATDDPPPATRATQSILHQQAGPTVSANSLALFILLAEARQRRADRVLNYRELLLCCCTVALASPYAASFSKRTENRGQRERQPRFWMDGCAQQQASLRAFSAVRTSGSGLRSSKKSCPALPACSSRRQAGWLAGKPPCHFRLSFGFLPAPLPA